MFEAAQSYKQNLVSCGYKEKLTYVEQSVKNQKETKKNTSKKSYGFFDPIVKS